MSAPLGQLLLRSKTTVTISVTWGVGAAANTIPEGNYVVRITPGNIADVLVNNEERNVDFTLLNPATLYSIRLIEQGNDVSSIDVLTGMLTPQQFHDSSSIVEINGKSVSLTIINITKLILLTTLFVAMPGSH